MSAFSTQSGPIVAVVGATGAVGGELIALLAERRFPIGQLRLFASGRSVGASIPFQGASVDLEELTTERLIGVDLAFFCATGDISRQWALIAAEQGSIVIDNSSAYRMDPETPLIVPEVNPGDLHAFEAKNASGVIANPNCSTILLLVAVHPLRAFFGVERLVISTYQAASGAGAQAMRELETQSRAVLAGETPECKVFPEPCAFNVFSHNSAVDLETGRNIEEQKLIDEARKIWRDDTLRLTATCVRAPVMRAHAESVNVQLTRPATEAEIRAALAKAPGVTVLDDRVKGRFPTSLAATGVDDVLIGRIRPDASLPAENGRFSGFDLFLCGDQLRKGAALNAVQIAECLVSPDRADSLDAGASEKPIVR